MGPHAGFVQNGAGVAGSSGADAQAAADDSVTGAPIRRLMKYIITSVVSVEPAST